MRFTGGVPQLPFIKLRLLAASAAATCVALAACTTASAQAPEPEFVSLVAFGSCANQEAPQPIWDPIVQAKPDLFLFIGDNIYADTNDMAVMRRKYGQLGEQSGFRQLLQTCPVLAVWDDHDFGANDAGAGYPMKAESQIEFLRFFREPQDSPRWKRAGLYNSYVYGPPGRRVQVILLDTRYFRSDLKRQDGRYVPNNDKKATMLGKQQWKWLAEQLKAEAELRIVVSSIQVVAEDHGSEKWMNLPLERQKLFQTVRDSGAKGVLFVSGDRHLAELSVIPDAIGYPAFDLTSSALNRSHRGWRPLETNRYRVGTINWTDNFGAVQIDWSQPDPLLQLQVRDVSGDVVLRQKIPLSLLSPK